MIDISPRDLETVKRILAKRVPGCEVRAFGSRVSWTAKSASDLDLAIIGDKKVSRRILTQLKADFEDSALPFTVDVLDWHKISPEFQQNISKQYEIIQDSQSIKTIAEGWRYLKVSEFAEVVGGGTPSSKLPEYWNDDIPWLTPKDMSDHQGRYICCGKRNISRLGLENSSARLVPACTVLLTSRASVGYVAIAKNPLTTNQGFRSLIIKDGFYHEFVYYLFLHNTEYLRQHATGSTFLEISGSTLKGLEFLIPTFAEQRAIAKILGDLDDKIELNRQINQALEQIAQAIFKSWFIDFDPVKAKIRAKTALTQTLSQRERASKLPSPSGRGAGGEGSIRAEGKKLPPKLLAAARDLRKNQTNAEKLLWQMLRSKQLADCKFRRQHPVGGYILDFYCHEKKLAVELDGGQHNEPEQRKHDEARTDWLKEQGIEVLRFWNNDVLQKPEAVMEEIYWTLTTTLTQTLSQGERAELPSPSGRGAGGEGKESEDLSFLEKALKDPIERAAMCAISGKADEELDQLPTETLDQLAATAALFPDELVESELGLIPKGWEVKPLSQMVELIGGGTPPKIEPLYWNGDVPWFSVRDAPNEGDVLKRNTHGAVFDTITRNTFDTVFCVKPKDGMLNEFEGIVKPLLARIKSGLIENLNLKSSRDSLLPKLLSGEISVPEAEKFVEPIV